MWSALARFFCRAHVGTGSATTVEQVQQESQQKLGPKFREARTADHNQLRAVVLVVVAVGLNLKSSLSEGLHIFEERSLAATGLRLQGVPVEEVSVARGETAAREREGDSTGIL